jgi:hypothetical protein
MCGALSSRGRPCLGILRDELTTQLSSYIGVKAEKEQRRRERQ